jgi:hypothetical protein
MGKNLPKFYLDLPIAPCQLIVCFAERIPKERVATTSISTLIPGRKASSIILSLPKAGDGLSFSPNYLKSFFKTLFKLSIIICDRLTFIKQILQ